MKPSERIREIRSNLPQDRTSNHSHTSSTTIVARHCIAIERYLDEQHGLRPDRSDSSLWIPFDVRPPRGHEHANGYHVGKVGDVSPIVRHESPLDADAFAKMLGSGWTHWRSVDIPDPPSAPPPLLCMNCRHFDWDCGSCVHKLGPVHCGESRVSFERA